MSSNGHPQTCRCSLHASLDARRHECYRDLARAILGDQAPTNDLALARALADHARLLALTNNVTPFRRRPAA